ncbi:ATP-binding protein [Pacificibacter sp. AS14]|uniref:ATP-binding protein n=1 Tax=Pacificibacter sp. AS14 TaxID=3135785 RepID=UPI003170766E
MRPEKILDVSLSSDRNFQGDNGALRLIIPANERSVRRGLLTIKSGMSNLSLSQEDWSTVELVIAEVLNNIVEHAYSDSESGLIEAHLDYSHDTLQCKVIDTGRSMPNGKLPKGAPKDLTCNIADLPEGGFGWFLIHQLTRDLNYARHSNQNTLSFRLPFASKD